MIKWFNSESTELDSLFRFCEQIFHDKRTGWPNMDVEDFKNKPHTLLYKLLIEKVFDTGGYAIFLENGNPICGSGFLKSLWHPEIYIIGYRSYTANKHLKYYGQKRIWLSQIDHAQKAGARAVFGHVNTYNTEILEKHIRINDPQRWPRSYCQDGVWYKRPGGARIYPFEFYPHSVNINYTEQLIFYNLLDPDFQEQFLSVCAANHF